MNVNTRFVLTSDVPFTNYSYAYIEIYLCLLCPVTPRSQSSRTTDFLTDPSATSGDTPCLFSDGKITASPRRKSTCSVRVPSPLHVAKVPPPPSSITSRYIDIVSTLPASLWFSSVTPPPLE